MTNDDIVQRLKQVNDKINSYLIPDAYYAELLVEQCQLEDELYERDAAESYFNGDDDFYY